MFNIELLIGDLYLCFRSGPTYDIIGQAKSSESPKDTVIVETKKEVDNIDIADKQDAEIEVANEPPTKKHRHTETAISLINASVSKEIHIHFH